MEKLAHDVCRYLMETLGISVKTEPWEGEGRLPFYLRNLYAFFQMSILDSPCLVMTPKKDADQTPAVLHKHVLQAQQKWGHEVIYAARKITAYNRKRLIEHKVPFVVPRNQMYLPPLGIDLREHFKTIRNLRPKWSPSTQAAFLYVLIHDRGQGWTPKEMADHLGYVPMSMSRAFDELEAAELGRITMEGKQRVLRLDQDKRVLWENALTYLQSPVKRRIWVDLGSKDPPGVEAGLAALARYSTLAGPANPVFAMEGKEWKRFRRVHDSMELPFEDPKACALEIWTYSPELFAENGVADRFSVYLSLQGTEDERVESALEEMMEQIRW